MYFLHIFVRKKNFNLYIRHFLFRLSEKKPQKSNKKRLKFAGKINDSYCFLMYFFIFVWRCTKSISLLSSLKSININFFCQHQQDLLSTAFSQLGLKQALLNLSLNPEFLCFFQQFRILLMFQVSLFLVGLYCAD